MEGVFLTKKLVVIATVFLMLSLCAASAYAYFFSTSESSVDARTGTVRVELNEDFPAAGDEGAPLDTVKKFSGANTGDKAAYVRARIFPAPEYYVEDAQGSGQWRPLALPTSAFAITTNAPAWIDGGDGYWYYSKILRPQVSTSEVTVTVKVASSAVLPQDVSMRLNLRVELESAQATNNAYQRLFGIANLPAGVEES